MKAVLLPRSSFSHVQQSRASGTAERKVPMCALSASCLLPGTTEALGILLAALTLAGPRSGNAAVFSNAVGNRGQVCKAGMLEQGLSCPQLCFFGGLSLSCVVPCSLKGPAGSRSLCPGSPFMHQKDHEGQLFQRWS